MAMATRTNVICAFEDRQQAQRAVDALRRAGFREDQIGIAARDAVGDGRKFPDKESHAEEGALTGAVAGAGVGGLWAIGIAAGLLPAIGPVIAGGLLASVLASAAGTAAVGSIVGALIGMGVPEDEANYYDTEFKAGRTIVTVRPEERHDEALTILRTYAGYEMGTPRTPVGTMGA